MDLSDWIVPFIIFCVLGFWKLVFIWQSSKKLRPPLPPGPWGLPILGYLPFLNRNASFLSFHQLSRRYGPIYRVKLGLVPVVVVADSDLIKTAFKEEAFSGKPPLYITNGIMRGYGKQSLG